VFNEDKQTQWKETYTV